VRRAAAGETLREIAHREGVTIYTAWKAHQTGMARLRRSFRTGGDGDA
jgi:hypothetical protein